ncbi:MAG: hypothetical protein CSB28_01105 [Desulfobacterales bacterium]|nr:MAG: hypothetical protein CSB28_01105 [Desulfobacterales bacterium]
MQKGIDSVLDNSGFMVKHFYMDTKRDNSPEWLDISGKLALEIVALWKPDLVIAMDDNAQKYFSRFLANKKDAPLVVFSGVNASPAKYGFPATNVTGVLERPNVLESIELLIKIYPGKIKKMLFLSDKSSTTDPFHDYIKTLKLPVEIVASKQPLTFDEWKQTVDTYKDKVDAIGLYVSRTVKREAGSAENVPEEELIGYINSTTALPTVGFFDSATEAGVLCAVSVSMEEQGRQAALIAVDLLRKNKKIEDIEIIPTKKGRIQLNLKVAEEKGIIIPYNVMARAKFLVR